MINLGDTNRVRDVKKIYFNEFFLLKDFEFCVDFEEFREHTFDFAGDLVLLFLKVVLLTSVLVYFLVVLADFSD